MNGLRLLAAWRLRSFSTAAGLFLGLACALLLPQKSIAASSDIPRPPELERDVQFWIRVYTEITTNAGFLHDEHNLAVVYQTVKFEPDTSPKQRQKIVDAARDNIIATLRRIATSKEPLSPEEQRIRDLWGDEGTPIRLLEATNHVRFQLGQADRFREGLIRSGAWEAYIAETFANKGLPPELAVLPHVESSFNTRAYSKVGAAGMWQFMRSTGRRYMRIDDVVDDRMDPFRSTEAAAQFLQYNYRLLGSWPLALTAYNHGPAGMRRAKEVMGTDDIVTIVRKYKSPTFGFASRNFYVSFLAALEIDRNPEKYFGPIERLPEVRFREVEMPRSASISTLEKVLNISAATLREYNPALLPVVWRGRRHVPKGYPLRLPLTSEEWTTELLAQRLAPVDELAGELASNSYRVRPGDTLSGIAKRYGVSVAALADLNDMNTRSVLRVGTVLRVPDTQQSVAAAVAPEKPVVRAATPSAAEPSAAKPAEGNYYVVRRGDALSEIAKKVGVSEAQLLKINRIRNPNYIFEGQRLKLREEAEEPESVAEETPTRVAATTATAGGRVSPAEAAKESKEDEVAVAKVAKPAERAQPVSAAQVEAISPALGPAIETTASTDPVDYTVKNDTIRVAAAETLGHYADWLGVSASRLRKLNGMQFGKPVLIGQSLKLDFSKVKPEVFEEKRREYHRTLQAQYFAAHRILGTEIYIVRRGDSLWTVTQRYSRLPVWLLQQYNPDVDLGSMRPGTQIVVPRVEVVESADG